MRHQTDFSAGAYLNYPAWGYPVNSYVYYAVSVGTQEPNSFSSLLIVSANSNTYITITPSVTVTIPSDLSPTGSDTILNAGQSITIQLQYLETLLLKPTTALADLTGTKVESNEPISVYSGHTCGNIPTNQYACNFIGEQLLPVASWGNEFLVQSFYSRSSGYNLKLIGSRNNTSVSITCGAGNDYSLSLGEGDVLSQTITQTSCYINSTKPIFVAQFSQGQFAGTGNGDPAMTVIPPLHHYSNNVTSFPVISLLNSQTYVNLFVLTSSNSSQIRLNGNLLPPLLSTSWKHYNGSCGYYVFNSYSLTGSGGEVSIWSDNYNDKILAMVYGLNLVGYSYTGSLNLRPSRGTCKCVNCKSTSIHRSIFIVPCFVLCEVGYSLNVTTYTCVLSNICHLSPCQNGGSCTLVSAPSNYTCDCTGTYYQGVNCSDCKYIMFVCLCTWICIYNMLACISNFH